MESSCFCSITSTTCAFLSLVPKLIIPKGFSIGAIALNEDGILLESIKFPINNYDVFVENKKGIILQKKSLVTQAFY